jgi:hypothetical protein
MSLLVENIDRVRFEKLMKTADQILQALQATDSQTTGSPAMLSRSELFDLFGRNIYSNELDAALMYLLATGKVRRKHRRRPNGLGRPAEIWFAV